MGLIGVILHVSSFEIMIARERSTMLRSLILLVGFAACTFSATAQNKVRWMTWEDALAAQADEPRKIVVDIYTDWCGWCKKMDKATFQKDHIAKYINTNFYAVKFDAETKETIVYNGKEYNYVSNGRRGYHELAVAITQGKLSFPTVTFIDEDLNVIQPIGGFQGPESFEMIMTYFAENYYTHTPWRSFTRSYQARQQPQSIPVRGN